ncbi:MAG: SDR family oxidoreductase [Anaerolineae bacterium]|nr:SDR family oxidoreductase [Anaerolineae bacterium]
MADSAEKAHENSTTRPWLLLGAAIGVVFGLVSWRRRRARQTSPLIREGERSTALVTGASSGIGRSYAIELASLGYDLILVARRRDRLQALATELIDSYGIRVAVVEADLAMEEGVTQVERAIAAADALTVLVNNAGFGMVSWFATSDLQRHLDMVQLHIEAVVRLTRAALPGMLALKRGAVVNVGSLMAFYPLYGNTTYSATKCYLRTFSEVLHQELIGTGVRVQALCPGFVATEFQQSADIQKLAIPDFAWMSPETVVRRSLIDLRNNQVISVPGLGYRLLADVSGLIPRPLLRLAGLLIGRSRTRRPPSRRGDSHD